MLKVGLVLNKRILIDQLITVVLSAQVCKRKLWEATD